MNPPLALPKDPMRPDTRAAVAEARELVAKAPCPRCGNKGMRFDYSFQRAPFKLRYYEHCDRCGYNGRF